MFISLQVKQISVSVKIIIYPVEKGYPVKNRAALQYYVASIVSLLVLISLNAGAHQLSCQDFYAGLSSKRKWLASQAARARDYIRNSSQEQAIGKILLEANQKAKDIVVPLESTDFTISIVDQGLASRTPVDVIMKNTQTGEQTVLLSSQNFAGAPVIKNFKNNNTTIPVFIQMSPKHDYLLVKMSAKGSIDEHTIVIIDLASKKIIQELELADSGAPVWISDSTFIYRERLANNPMYRVKIKEGIVSKSPYNSYDVGASKDQQWFYFHKSYARETIFANTVSGKTVSVFQLMIDEIVKTEKEPALLWIKTKGANGFKELVQVRPNGEKPVVKTIVAEGKMVIDSVSIEKDHIALSKYLGADRQMDFLDLDGNLLDRVMVPDCCALSFSAYDVTARTAKITLQSPVQKKMAWIYDFKTKEWLVEDLNKEFKPAQPIDIMMTVGGEKYITEYRDIVSKDGTVIPMRVTYRRGILFGGNAPTLLEGYGGFGLNSYFHPQYVRMTHEFIRAGGVHLAPALRGSYFFGRQWHNMGRAENKQNVVDDFIAAAEWAIHNGITRPKRLAISGASHGGFVVGAALTQRPELFGIAFPQYGPLAFHQKSELDPLMVKLQVYEYGDLLNDSQAKARALEISPLARIRPNKYPMVVLMEGQNDSRVNPEHSTRFFEKLTLNQLGKEKIFLYTLPNSGHWMTSINRQDFIGWRSSVTFWSSLFKYMDMNIVP